MIPYAASYEAQPLSITTSPSTEITKQEPEVSAQDFLEAAKYHAIKPEVKVGIPSSRVIPRRRA